MTHAAKSRRPAITARYSLGWDLRVTGGISAEHAIPLSTMGEFRSLISKEHRGKLYITPSTRLFCQLAAEGLIDELQLTFQPRFIGGQAAEPITGLAPAFLPRGIMLNLISARRSGAGYLAAYRVRRSPR